MSRFTGSARTAVDYNCTIIGALELSQKKWVLAVQLPGVSRHSRHPAGRPATHMRRERRRGFWRARAALSRRFELPTMCSQPLLVAPRPKHVVSFNLASTLRG
jgi:hypothetical protein